MLWFALMYFFPSLTFYFSTILYNVMMACYQEKNDSMIMRRENIVAKMHKAHVRNVELKVVYMLPIKLKFPYAICFFFVCESLWNMTLAVFLFLLLIYLHFSYFFLSFHQYRLLSLTALVVPFSFVLCLHALLCFIFFSLLRYRENMSFLSLLLSSGHELFSVAKKEEDIYSI